MTMTNAERQALWRQRRARELEQLRAKARGQAAPVPAREERSKPAADDNQQLSELEDQIEALTEENTELRADLTDMDLWGEWLKDAEDENEALTAQLEALRDGRLDPLAELLCLLHARGWRSVRTDPQAVTFQTPAREWWFIHEVSPPVTTLRGADRSYVEIRIGRSAAWCEGLTIPFADAVAWVRQWW
jgi:hypothetical protein